MELRSTKIGRSLAQHPYHSAKLLNAGIEVCGEQNRYLISFTQLISIQCKRGIIWGEMEFELADDKVIRLHGTEWQSTKLFYQTLQELWDDWSYNMSRITADLLAQLVEELHHYKTREDYLNKSDLEQVHQKIHTTFQALPLQIKRLKEFDNCYYAYLNCLEWLERGETLLQEHNQFWKERLLKQHHAFFDAFEGVTLSKVQRTIVMSSEPVMFVSGASGTGKTTALLAKAAWLQRLNMAEAQNILFIVADNFKKESLANRLRCHPVISIDNVKTITEVAIDILNYKSKKSILAYPENEIVRKKTILKTWQQLCGSKKGYAKEWAEWLEDEFKWELDEEMFWQDPHLSERMSDKLENWLEILASSTLSTKEMVESVEEEQVIFQTRLRLLSPLLKSAKEVLKQNNWQKKSDLITKAKQVLSSVATRIPWQYLLVDDLQAFTSQEKQFLMALKAQLPNALLIMSGNDWGATEDFNSIDEPLLSQIEEQLSIPCESFYLEQAYRLNNLFLSVITRFMRNDPIEMAQPILDEVANSSVKHPIVLLPNTQWERLLDALSSFVLPQERIIIIARETFLFTQLKNRAKTRWPKMMINCMTFNQCQGIEADYVLVIGLDKSTEGLPVSNYSCIEKVLISDERNSLVIRERRLLYNAMTRAAKKVWLLYDKKSPSIFVKELLKYGGVKKNRI